MKTRSHLYWIWGAMIQRCHNPKNKQFPDYGGRGITVCARWRNFQNFEADMAPRPSGLMIDRIDNDRGYEPSNCRWTTRKEQNSNRRSCIHVDDNGERVTVKEYCRRRDLPYRAIMKRITRRNWPVAEALAKPLGSRRSAA